jgi:thiamine-phosphate pyrophosphorylase
MSLPDLSPAVERAVQNARRLAALEKLAEAAPVHLFAALIQEEEGRAAVLLRKAGAEHSTLAATFLGGPDPATPVQEDTLPILGDLSHAVLVRARSFAVELAGERVVASEHVLLALLETDRALQKRLQALGLDLGNLESLIKGDQEIALPMEELEILEPTAWIDAARILDASANRAREGLRVVEDFCRFALDDRFLVEEAKQIRHALTSVLGEIPVQARDTQGDVGVSVTTVQEGQRASPLHVVRANLKRVQEALRSLEEYAKYAVSRSPQTIEQLRYRTYTLERMILMQDQARAKLAQTKLYVLLTRGLATASLEWTIQEAAAGGAGMFQLREKNYNDRELLEVARDVRRLTRETRTLFIMNDRPDIARLVGADGVHLGQLDMTVKDARRILGAEAIIGVSTHKLEDIHKAVTDGASYVGVGPTFPSGTKEFTQLAGLEFVRAAAGTTGLPWFAIGGIKGSNVAEVVKAGARRIAVSQAVIAADEPRIAAAQLVEALGTPPINQS